MREDHSSTRMLATTAKLAALGCLVHTAAAVPRDEDSSSPKLYVCQGGQCVLNVAGLPLSECEAACIPLPSANYTCQDGQCVINSRGLPKAECDLVCGGPGPAPPPAPPAKPNIVQLAESVPDLSTLVEALRVGNLTGALSSPGPFTVFDLLWRLGRRRFCTRAVAPQHRPGLAQRCAATRSRREATGIPTSPPSRRATATRA